MAMAASTLNPKKRKCSSEHASNKISKKQKKKPAKKEKASKTKTTAQDSKTSLFVRLIDSGTILEHEPVFYLRKKDKAVMKEGWFTRDGVLCACCNQLFLLSKFEVHAGSSLHRPSANMFLRDGRSITRCQQSIEDPLLSSSSSSVRIMSEGPFEKIRESLYDCTSDGNSYRKPSEASYGQARDEGSSSGFVSDQSVDGDNVCLMCGDVGELMLCDTCPSAFHAKCLYLNDFPEGNWQCSCCRCRACGEGLDNHGHEGNIESKKVDRDTQVRDDLVSHEGDPNSHVGENLVSHEENLNSSGEDLENRQGHPSNMLCCSHCNQTYHRKCVDVDSYQESENLWFCSKHCRHVFKSLRNMVGQVFHLDNGDLSWVLLRSFEEDNGPSAVNLEKKLSEGLKIFRECFDPILDYVTKLDFLSQTTFNKKANIRRLDCRGFYTFLLTKGEEAVSVATIRIHGNRLAEMPFVATKGKFRKLGMCKVLMRAMEGLLQKVGVYRLILPSIPEMSDLWTGQFGFKAMSFEERKEVSDLVLMSFAGTSFLHKDLFEFGVIQQDVDDNESRTALPRRGLIRVKVKLLPPQPISCH